MLRDYLHRNCSSFFSGEPTSEVPISQPIAEIVSRELAILASEGNTEASNALKSTGSLDFLAVLVFGDQNMQALKFLRNLKLEGSKAHLETLKHMQDIPR